MFESSWQAVRSALDNLGAPTSEIQQRVDDALRKVKLDAPRSD